MALVLWGLSLSNPGLAAAQGQRYTGWAGAARVASRLNYADLSGHWAKEAILRVAALGVLTATGDRFRPQAALTREEILAALLALSGNGNNGTTVLDRAEGAGLVNREERARLEGALSAPAERQEVAAWLARAAGLVEATGAGNVRVAAFGDAGKVRPEYRGFIEALLEKGWLAGRGGRLAPTAAVTRAEAASLLYRALPEVLPRQGWLVFQGIVVGREEARLSQGLRLTFVVLTTSGQSVELMAGPGAGTAWGPDWLTIAGGRVSTAGALASGQAVRVWVNPPTVVMVEVLSSQAQSRRAVLEAVNSTAGEITVIVGGQRTVLGLAPGVKVTVAGQPARPADLLPGQEVTLSLRAGLVEQVAAELPPVDLPAYAQTPARVVTGYLAGREGTNLRVTLTGGGEETFALTSVTVIVSGSRTLSASDLRPGDRVRLTVFGDSSGVISRVEVAAEYPREELWCGRLVRVLVPERAVLVSQPRRLYFGRWRFEEGQRAFTLAAEAGFYLGSRTVSLEELAGQTGGQVFLSLSRAFGRKEVAWLAVEEGEPWIYQDRLADWNPGWRKLALSGGTGLVLAEGARVLRGGRVVDPSDLEAGRPVVAVAAGDTGLFVEQPEYYPPAWSFFCGTLRRLEEKKLVLYRWRRYDGDYWSATSYQEKELTLSASTVALDGTKETPVLLDLHTFLESRYTDAFVGRQVYLVADGEGRVVALALRGEERGPEVAALGTVREGTDGRRRLEEVLAWSPEYRSWRELGTTLTLDFSRALVFRGGTWVGPAGLTEGSQIYLLHDYQEALAVFLQ
ncbi:MAG: S-layer homology domain-containing protein [Moorellales bacterium]